MATSVRELVHDHVTVHELRSRFALGLAVDVVGFLIWMRLGWAEFICVIPRFIFLA